MDEENERRLVKAAENLAVAAHTIGHHLLELAVYVAGDGPTVTVAGALGDIASAIDRLADAIENKP